MYIPRIAGPRFLFYSAVENDMGAVNNDGIYITDNVFYGSKDALLFLRETLWDGKEKVNRAMVFSGNTYAQSFSGVLCRSDSSGELKLGDDSCEQWLLSLLGDQTGAVIRIP